MSEHQVQHHANVPDDTSDDNGLLWLLLCGALFILIFLPLVA